MIEKIEEIKNKNMLHDNILYFIGKNIEKTNEIIAHINNEQEILSKDFKDILAKAKNKVDLNNVGKIQFESIEDGNGHISESKIEQSRNYCNKLIHEMERKELPHRVCFDKVEIDKIKNLYEQAYKELEEEYQEILESHKWEQERADEFKDKYNNAKISADKWNESCAAVWKDIKDNK